MITQRAYKFRCYPTADQQQQLAVDFGCARFVWNTALDARDFAWRVLGRSENSASLSRAITEMKQDPDYAWLNVANSTVLTQKLRDLDVAYQNFFAGRAKFPRFKKKSDAQSVRYQLDQRQIAKNYRPGKLLRLPKIGPLTIRWSRMLKGIPKMATVTRDSVGRYFVSFACEETIEPLPQRTNAVGVDLGVKDVIVTSDGFKSGNPKHWHRLERRLKRAQRSLSRKRKGSNRWQRQKRIVAKLHAKIADARRDFLHKATTGLIQSAQVIALEDLNIQGMLKNHSLAKAIGDVGMHEFRRQVEYKAAWYGRAVIFVDRFAPTSKTCSECDHVQETMPLKLRQWQCPDCGASHDRDVNAAKNILMFATAGKVGSYKARGLGKNLLRHALSTQDEARTARDRDADRMDRTAA